MESVDLSGWKVVVIDDEPENRGVAEYILTFFKATVHCEETGMNCLEVLRAQRPTFLLLDISMPRKSGWDVLKEIRADADFKSLPVIALTAHAMTGDEERGLRAGFDGYITKPISPKTLVQQIKDTLERVTSRGEPAKQGETASRGETPRQAEIISQGETTPRGETANG